MSVVVGAGFAQEAMALGAGGISIHWERMGKGLGLVKPL